MGASESPRWTGGSAGPGETDVVVIGLGPGGLRVARLLAAEGLSVLGVEQNLVGGECRFFGCTPSKMLVRAGELVAEARTAAPLTGHEPRQPSGEQAFRRIAEEGVHHWNDDDTVSALEKDGVGLLRGRGRLLGPGRVDVEGKTLRARRAVVIATGTAPAIPPVDGLEAVPFLTNRDVFRLSAVPRSMVCLGGGPIGVEISQALARLGVAVTVVEAEDRVLAAEEPEASRIVAEILRCEGIDVIEGAAAERATASDGGVVVTVGDRELRAEQLLVASGRDVCVADIGLESVGIEVDDVIPVDDRLRAAPGIWAIGDVTGKGPYTHVAEYQAEIAAADILGRADGVRADYRAVPRVTFADPEVGAVGTTEAAARDDGTAVSAVTVDIDESSRAWLHGAADRGLVKLVADTDRQILLGATVVAPTASEMLAQLTLAVHGAVPLRQLLSMIYAFPSFHDAVEAAIRKLGVSRM